jgi:hypothetical protein
MDDQPFVGKPFGRLQRRVAHRLGRDRLQFVVPSVLPDGNDVVERIVGEFRVDVRIGCHVDRVVKLISPEVLPDVLGCRRTERPAHSQRTGDRVFGDHVLEEIVSTGVEQQDVVPLLFDERVCTRRVQPVVSADDVRQEAFAPPLAITPVRPDLAEGVTDRHYPGVAPASQSAFWIGSL